MALVLEGELVQLVKPSEVEMDVFPRSVIDTSGGDHVPVAMATNGLGREDHGEYRIIDTV